MQDKIRKLLKRRDENGSAEIITTLFVMPFLLYLILALIDISLYMNTRSSVESVTRDAVRQAAMWGGTGPSVRLNPTGKGVDTLIFNRLYEGGKCNYSSCIAPPSVTCGPTQVSNAGTPVSCTVTYKYKSVVPGMSLLGFEGITKNAEGFTITEKALSETGYR